VELKFDRDAAERLGVEVADVIGALQQFFGSEYVNDFNRFGRTWQVTVQASPKFRHDLRDLSAVQVPNRRTGEMVPVREFFRTEETVGPALVVRYNLHPVAPVSANSAAGVSSGQAMKKVEELVGRHLEPGMKAEWTELARLQLETDKNVLAGIGIDAPISTAFVAFALSVVLVFLVLAAQYESWALPLAVILVVPMCLLSAVVGVRLAGHDVNIFTQIGFVVLVGLASKNAILIVEFARARHTAGATICEATIEACKLRLRPIIMTSVAFILGVVPLVIAEGAGSEMRRTLGTAVFAGMIGVTAFGVFLTPVFYFAIQWVVDKLRGEEAQTEVCPGTAVPGLGAIVISNSVETRPDRSVPAASVVDPTPPA
jgi:multidrug efflux pump subunit AcrB